MSEATKEETTQEEVLAEDADQQAWWRESASVIQGEDPVRFGAEFGPKRTKGSTGVSLSTFKTLVWVSNLGGLLLFVIGLELMTVQQRFYLGLACIVAGIIIALFPSNYEIVGMDGFDLEEGEDDS